jgi:flavin-dependent dehydrogenase
MANSDHADWLGDAERTLTLEDGSSVAVVGGGPAGSFFSYFALQLADRLRTEITLDIYEPRVFTDAGPPGCNMCGGIISESLIQLLAAEGISFPPAVIQRGVDSYMLHTDVGKVRIRTPLNEKRIGAVHRGTGPKGSKGGFAWESFDGHLQKLAVGMGANVVSDMVRGVSWTDGRPTLTTKHGTPKAYDLVVVATGVNSRTLELFEALDMGYEAPLASKTAIREFHLGEEVVDEYLGHAMHVFLLDIPRLEFAAIIPKGDHATVCLLGKDIDQELVDTFLAAPETRACFPPDWEPSDPVCKCWPNINMDGSGQPYADRMVFIGDSGVARLYKDGIGSAYRTAKAAASTALLHGISAADFEAQFLPACKVIEKDNRIGRFIFWVTHLVQHTRFARKALVRMVAYEQASDERAKRMSMVLWDMFTGSAPYREALGRTFHPLFGLRFLWDILVALIPFTGRPKGVEEN